MILKIFSPKNLAKIGVFTQNTASLCYELIITCFFLKKTPIFLNIDPRTYSQSKEMYIFTLSLSNFQVENQELIKQSASSWTVVAGRMMAH
jgi:hypothetical protein